MWALVFPVFLSSRFVQWIESADEFAEAGAVFLGELDVGFHAAGEVLTADQREWVTVVAKPFEDAEHEQI